MAKELDVKTAAEENSDDGTKAEKKPYTKARKIVKGVVFVAVLTGFFLGTGTGTLSNFGWDYISAICPLGALEAMIGSRSIAVHLLIALAVVVAIVLLTGRAFCSWVCPVPLLSDFFKTKKRRREEAAERVEAADVARRRFSEGVKSPCAKQKLDSRHVVLLGALGSTAVFGFPVFCLVCPIGLTFATLIGVVRLVGFNEPSWGLLLFPAILLLELVFFRKWCTHICPMGALLSLLSRFSKTFKPTVDESKCLRCAGDDLCGACAASCPEHIDPQSNKGLVAIEECTRCGKCAETCPSGAISLPLFASPKRQVQPEEAKQGEAE